MQGINTHKQAIVQITAELGLPFDQVEKICNMAFTGRGLLQKMKVPNVITLPGIGELVPDKAGVKRLRGTIAALERIRDAKKHRAMYQRNRDKAAPKVEAQEHFFEDCHYLKKLQASFPPALIIETNINKIIT